MDLAVADGLAQVHKEHLVFVLWPSEDMVPQSESVALVVSTVCFKLAEVHVTYLQCRFPE